MTTLTVPDWFLAWFHGWLALWLFIGLASIILFFTACVNLKVRDPQTGTWRNRLREPHHFYWGGIIWLIGMIMHIPWIAAIGAILMLEDGAVHTYQEFKSDPEGKIYPPDWKVGIFHRLWYQHHL